jgi:hypothetical protein
MATDVAGRADSEFDLAAAVGWIAGRRGILMLAIAAGATLGFVMAATAPTEYRAAATLALSPHGVNPGPVHARIASTEAAEEIVRTFQLDRLHPPLTPAVFLARHVRLEDVWGRGLIRIHIRLPDGRLAADIANALAERAAKPQAATMAEDGAVPTVLAKRQRDEAAERLRRAEQALGTSRQVMMNLAGTARRLFDDIHEEQAVLARVLIDLEREPEIGPSGDVNPRHSYLRHEERRRRARLASLVAQRDVLLARLGSAGVDPRADAGGDVRDLATREVDYEVARWLYVDASVAYEAAVIRQGASRPRLDLLERAAVPERPISRQPLTSAILGAIGALVLCAGLIGSRDLASRGVLRA